MHIVRLLNTILDLVKYWYLGWTFYQSSTDGKIFLTWSGFCDNRREFITWFSRRQINVKYINNEIGNAHP